MHHQLVGVASEERQHIIYTFTKRLMGWAPHTYACIRTSDVEIPFTTKVGSLKSTKRICSYAKSQQIDLLFAHFIIAAITFG